MRETKYTDGVLLEAYLRHGSFQSAARELGMSRQNLTARLKRRYDLAAEEAAYKSAREIVIVADAVIEKGQAVPGVRGLEQGIAAVNQKRRDMYAELHDLTDKLQRALDRHEHEMESHYAATKKQKPLHVDQLIKLVTAMQGMLRTCADFESKRYDAEGISIFISTVVDILTEFHPDAQKEIFIRISQRGRMAPTECTVH